MTHDEYLAGLEDWTDADAEAVLAHAAACTACRREARRAETALDALDGRPPGVLALRRWAAAAAFLALAGFGLWQDASPRPTPSEAAHARYRIVGDSSGVVAYTPAGIVVGTAARPSEKEIVR